MRFLIRRATLVDVEGIIDLIKDVSGPNEFILNELKNWISNEAKYIPLIALDDYSKEYAGFSNVRLLGNYCWLEGLRVSPKFRNNQVATRLLERSLSMTLGKNIHRMGFSTRNDNIPMLNLAHKMNFVSIGEQIVLIKRKSELALYNSYEIRDLMKIISNDSLYNSLLRRYDNQILTSFFRIPTNDQGKQFFIKIPIYETEDYYLLYELAHNETTDKRGIFTVYIKQPLSNDLFFDKINKLCRIKMISKYPTYSFAIPSYDVSFSEEFQNLAKENNFEVHLLKFFEKQE